MHLADWKFTTLAIKPRIEYDFEKNSWIGRDDPRSSDCAPEAILYGK